MNPIRRIREHEQLSRRELAAKADCSYSTVFATERALPREPNEAILTVLVQLGHSKTEMIEAYRLHRKAVGRKGHQENDQTSEV